jgi:hypothetical protein
MPNINLYTEMAVCQNNLNLECEQKYTPFNFETFFVLFHLIKGPDIPSDCFRYRIHSSSKGGRLRPISPYYYLGDKLDFL